MKNFKLKNDQIKPLIAGLGGCLATDHITVDGNPVMYMYRETPKNTEDSGWRFFSGTEDDEYMANNSNHGVYDTNTIANYDPSIIPYLTAKVGSAFERDDATSAFNEVME
jgi:hypothetical protein